MKTPAESAGFKGPATKSTERRPDFDRKFTGNFDNTVGAKSQQFPFAMRRDAFEVVPLEKLEGEVSGAASEVEVEKEDEPMPEVPAEVEEIEEKVEEEKVIVPKAVKEPKPEKQHRGQKKRDADAAEAAALKAAIMENADSDDQDEVDRKLDQVISKNQKDIKNKAARDEKTPEEVKAEVFSGDKFSDLPINNKLKEALEQNKFTELTEIQKKAIPTIIKSKNVIMKSETGSGKTLAYLVPLIEQLANHSMEVEKINRANGTYCIIFSPTRELCSQIDIELQRLTSKMFAYMICSTIMGGENPKKEKARLRKGVTILVCTPGRFLYHLQNTENIGLSRLQYMIIDEADRMLDMGFEREMDACLTLIKRRSNGRFKPGPDTFYSDHVKVNFISATLSAKVVALGAKLMESYESVGFVDSKKKKAIVSGAPGELSNVNLQDQESSDEENIIDSIPKQVKQFWMQIPTQYRLLYLLAFLYAHQDKKVIVFGSTCETINLLTQMCKSINWDTCINRRGNNEKEKEAAIENPSATVDFTMPKLPKKEEDKKSKSENQTLYDGLIYKLHGDMDHSDRKINFFGFDKAEGGSLLICTDVASRGLDFKSVDWVIQWDLSSQIKEYVNRVGRTARIASAGQSLCFVMTPTELKYVPFMQKNFKVEMHEKSRFTLMKRFEDELAVGAKKRKIDPKLVQFRKLKAIDDIDEK